MARFATPLSDLATSQPQEKLTQLHTGTASWTSAIWSHYTDLRALYYVLMLRVHMATEWSRTADAPRLCTTLEVATKVALHRPMQGPSRLQG